MNDCRLWAYETAKGYDDPMIEAGTYLCGIDPEGPPSREGLAKSYRKIAQ
ncbi:hypothetical protein GCM10009069_09380 [Algimonas arctica]|uniref:Uncharacterized protein n=1 Tax=Algimonas arctica TaxID=1479486 RepID=A0A8J3G1N3_9PROT|nr:hypothetical protein [Algimonas arctica]GHA88551.1 hypothetical protein GCM10009069_09380 [Algimonas arctica]